MRYYMFLVSVLSVMLVSLSLGNIPQPERVVTYQELSRAEAIIAEGISSHLYYIKYPQLQTSATGNTTFQRVWVDNYAFLRELIGRLE